MNRYEFAGNLHSSVYDLCDNIAHLYLTADGANGPETVTQSLLESSAGELARQCINDFELDRPKDTGLISRDADIADFDDDELRSHMDAAGYTIDDLEAAFVRFAENRPDILQD